MPMQTNLIASNMNSNDSPELPIKNNLDASTRRALRARGHTLNPVVSISQNGLSTSVLSEIDRCLTRHELIKIRVYNDDRQQREEFLQKICTQLGAEAVQHIGKLLLVFRHNPNLEPPHTRPKRRALRRTKRSYQNN